MTATTERANRELEMPGEPTCEAIWDDVESVCGEPAKGLFRRACIHEHVRDGWLCGGHLDNPRGHCRACWDLPGEMSHMCSIVLAEVAS